jgi:streptogramin lyase
MARDLGAAMETGRATRGPSKYSIPGIERLYDFVSQPMGRCCSMGNAMLLILWLISAWAQATAQESPARTWRIETVAGTGVAGHAGNGGPALQAQLDNPFGVIRGPDGCIWFCEYGGHRIRRMDSNGNVKTIAGRGTAGQSVDGTAIEACFLNLPHEIRFDRSGRLLVVDMGNHQVRALDFERGIIATVAGTGADGYSGDGELARDCQLRQPHSIQFDRSGDLFICDIGNHVLRRVDRSTGVIQTIGGIGKSGQTIDGGPLEGNPLHGPRSLDFDHQGHLWLGTREGNQLFEILPETGTIHLRAGTGKKGIGPRRVSGLQGTLNGPKGVTIDREGNVWLADTESHSILRYDPKSKTLERIAGTGTLGDGPDGAADACALARPHGVFADADGSIWIGDSESHRIRRLVSH